MARDPAALFPPAGEQGCGIRRQGLTGRDTLSLQSVIAATAIVPGMRVGLWWLERESAPQGEMREKQ
jgi:hypothetical protein